MHYISHSGTHSSTRSNTLSNTAYCTKTQGDLAAYCTKMQGDLAVKVLAASDGKIGHVGFVHDCPHS
jgi:hypothetical protein